MAVRERAGHGKFYHGGKRGWPMGADRHRQWRGIVGCENSRRRGVAAHSGEVVVAVGSLRAGRRIHLLQRREFWRPASPACENQRSRWNGESSVRTFGVAGRRTIHRHWLCCGWTFSYRGREPPALG